MERARRVFTLLFPLSSSSLYSLFSLPNHRLFNCCLLSLREEAETGVITLEGKTIKDIICFLLLLLSLSFFFSLFLGPITDSSVIFRSAWKWKERGSGNFCLAFSIFLFFFISYSFLFLLLYLSLFFPHVCLAISSHLFSLTERDRKDLKVSDLGFYPS